MIWRFLLVEGFLGRRTAWRPWYINTHLYNPIYIYVYDIDQKLITFDMYLGWVSMAANPWWHRGMMPLVGMVPDRPWHPQLPQLVPWWCEGYHVVPKDLKVGGIYWRFIGQLGERWSTVNSLMYYLYSVMLSPSDSVSIYSVRLWQFGSNFFPLQKVNMGFRLRSSWHGCRIWRATRGGGHCRGGSILTSWYPTILLWGLRRMTLCVLWGMTSWAEVVQKALACPCCNYYPNWHFQHMKWQLKGLSKHWPVIWMSWAELVLCAQKSDDQSENRSRNRGTQKQYKKDI